MPYLFPEKIHLIYHLGDILSICFILTAFSCSIAYIAYPPISENYVTDLKTNWDLSPIKDILIDSLENQTVYDSFGQWEGIKEGCDCTNSTLKPKKLIKTKQCNTTEVDGKCIQIAKVSPILYRSWKGKKIHAKRMESGNYTSFFSNIAEECSSGYHKCGKLDSLGRLLCLKDGEDCPINKIVFDTSSQSPTDYNYRQYN